MKILNYLKPYKKECLLAPFFKLIEASFELTVPLVVASAIDKGITAGDKGHIGKMTLLLVLFAVLGLSFTLIAQYFSAKAAVGFAKDIRQGLFEKIQSFSYSNIDNIGTSTLITRITSDVNQMQNGVNIFLRLVLRSPFVVFGAMIMAITVDAYSGLVFGSAIIILFTVVFAVTLISVPMYKKVQQKLDKLLSSVLQNLTGTRVIRAFRKEDDEKIAFLSDNEQLTQKNIAAGKVSAVLNPATYIIVNLAVIWLIHTGAIRVEAGILTQGAVVALYNYMSQILVELIKFANVIINLNKSIACGNRVQAIFDTENDMKFLKKENKNNKTENIVDFENVSFKYNETGDYAVKNISFTAYKGETIGVIGSTGSGKTTLINLLCRFYDASAGKIKISGMDISDYDEKFLREKIGIAPQKAVLFKGTVKSNMLLSRGNATDSEIYDALKIAQAEDFVNKKGGLDITVEQDGKNFSGGQKQRLTIARAIVKNSDILILDDSSSALDYATDAALRRAIHNMKNRPTVFIVSQRTASVRSADKILVLENGECVGLGTHDELLADCSVYKEIYDSQTKAVKNNEK